VGECARGWVVTDGGHGQDGAAAAGASVGRAKDAFAPAAVSCSGERGVPGTAGPGPGGGGFLKAKEGYAVLVGEVQGLRAADD